MDDEGPTASIIFVIFVLIGFLYYGFSTALEYVNEKEVERKAEEEKDAKSIHLLSILKDPKRPKNVAQTVLICVYMLTGYFCIDQWKTPAEEYLTGWIRKMSWEIAPEILEGISFVALSTVCLYLILVLEVFVPKKLAKTYPEKWAYAGVAFLRASCWLINPFYWLVNGSAYVILKLCGIGPDTGESDVTEEEIIEMVNEGQEQGILEAAEAEMISNIFEYRDKQAQDIMTHRNNIIALDGAMLLQDAIEEVLTGKQSRYPVYEENIDHVIGILHLKDALRYHADHDKLHSPLKQITDLLREPEFIPQTRNIDELFKEMQSKKLQMVIVIDEYGQTAGLVAMEDILEEIVGNIMDEYDEENEYIEEKGKDEYVIEGLTPLEELEERFEISFGEVEFETLNGFLISKMDKIPDEDEEFEVRVDKYHFKILSVENKMIQSVLVTRVPEEAVEESTEGETSE